MKPVDFAKAVGVALLIFAVDVAVSFLVVTVYAQLIEPGQSREFYAAATMKIAHWSSHIAGPLIFLAAAYLFARRRPQRNALKFTAAVCASYAAITLSMLVAIGTLQAAWQEGVVLTMGIKFVGAAIGVYLAGRASPRASIAP